MQRQPSLPLYQKILKVASEDARAMEPLARSIKEKIQAYHAHRPALTVTTVVFSIYILERLVKGSLYVLGSAGLGIAVLYVLQLPVERLPWALSWLGVGEDEGTIDNGDGPDYEGEENEDGDAVIYSRMPGGAEQEDGTASFDDICQSMGREGQDSGNDGPIQSQNSCAWDADHDGLPPGDNSMILGDWLESINGQDGQPGMQGGGQQWSGAGSEDAELNEPMSKARLNLLFNYLSNLEGGNNRQGATHATPQRMKLQRKLLQRTTAGVGEGNRAVKNGVEADGSAAEPLQEIEIEALLRELGEDPCEKSSPSQPKVAKAKGKPNRARQKGAATSAPSKELQGATASSSSKAAPPEPSPARQLAPATHIEPRRRTLSPSPVAASTAAPCSAATPTDAASGAKEEAVDDDFREPLGFQVVANRKARRNGKRRDSDEATDAPGSEPQPPASPQGAAAPAPANPAAGSPAGAARAKAKAEQPASLQRASASAPAKPAVGAPSGAHAPKGKAEQPASPQKLSSLAGNKPVESTDIAAKASVQGGAAATTTAWAKLAGAEKRPAEPAKSPAKVSGSTDSSGASVAPSHAVETSAVNSDELQSQSPASPAEGPVAKPEMRQSAITPADAEEVTVASQDAAAEVNEEKEDLEEHVEENDVDVGEDDGDWEWQCPDGFPLVEYHLPEALDCGSCGSKQAKGATVLRAEESGWLACQECIHIAFGQPVDCSRSAPEAVDASPTRLTEDPSRMTALEIATWFQEHNAVDSLRACMMQVISAPGMPQ